jgi:hypothetical protein
MTQNVFCQLAKQHFGYLVTEYKFLLVEEMGDPAAEGDGFLEYRSSDVFVDISSDRGQVTVDLGPYPKQPHSKYELGTMLWYLAGDRFSSRDLMQQSYTQTPDRPPDMSHEEYADLQLAGLASRLKQRCQTVLEGKFSEWSELARIVKEVIAAYYKNKTGLDYPEDAA